MPEARDAVSDWLAPLDVSAVDELAVRHAVGELVTNAVVHAHAGERRSARRWVEVDAELGADGVLSCRVHDDGRWQDPGRPEDGWGLALVAAMVDDLRIERGHGTTVTFRLRLGRTVRMMAGRHHRDGGRRASTSLCSTEVRTSGSAGTSTPPAPST